MSVKRLLLFHSFMGLIVIKKFKDDIKAIYVMEVKIGVLKYVFWALQVIFLFRGFIGSIVTVFV